jgi:hypothetical protein
MILPSTTPAVEHVSVAMRAAFGLESRPASDLWVIFGLPGRVSGSGLVSH